MNDKIIDFDELEIDYYNSPFHGSVSTFSSGPHSGELTLEILQDAVKVLDSFIPPTPVTPKLIIGSKKHHREFMKQLRENTEISPFSSFFGVPIYFYIKPYLKKMRIVDIDQFKYYPANREIQELGNI